MQKYCKVHTLSRYQPRNGHFLESESRSNVRVTSEPLLSAESEFAQTSEAGRKLPDFPLFVTMLMRELQYLVMKESRVEAL